MNFRHKSALMMFLLGGTLLLVLTVVYYFANQGTAIRQARVSSTHATVDSAHSISLFLMEKGRVAETIATAPTLTKALIQSNSDFAKLSDTKRTEQIEGLNKKWQAARSKSDPIVQRAMDNPTADYLKKQQKIFPNEYGEIFLTNRYGALVASTGKLTTFAHSHKYWWRRSYSEGKGKIFFDDRGFDTSVKGYVLGVVVPVRQGSEIIGILKCNLNITDAITNVIKSLGTGGVDTLKLVRAGGLVVLEKGKTPLSTKVPSILVNKMQAKSYGSIIFQDKGYKELLGYAPVKLTLESDKYAFGGSKKSIDHLGGNMGEGWYVASSEPMEQVLKAAGNATRNLILIGGGVCFAMVFGSLLLGKTLAKPIMSLVEQTRKIGQGDFKSVVKFTEKGELGVLAKSFNTMADNLHQTVISRDVLVDEVEQRKAAEKSLALARDELQKQIVQLRDAQNISQSMMEDLSREVIDRKHAEESLGVFRRFAEESTPGMGWADIDGNLIYINRALCQMFQAERPEETYGHSVLQFYDDKTQEKLTKEIFPLVLDKGRWTGELQIQTKGGNTLDTLNTIFILRDGEGNPLYFANVVADLTERKRAEEDLRFQAMLLDSISDHVTATDLEGQFTYLNQAACESIGKAREELIGKSIEAFGEDPNEGATQQEIVKATNEQGKWEGEIVNFNSAGDRKIVECKTWLLHDEKNNPIGMCGIAHDITERKRAEKAMAEQTRHREMLLDSLPHPAMLIDKNRVIISSNSTAVEIGAIPGKNCWSGFGKCQYIPEGDKQYFEENNTSPPDGTHCSFCLADECLVANDHQRDQEVEAFGRIWDTHWVALDNETFLHYAIDVTEQKEKELEREQLLHITTERVKELDCLYSLSHLIEIPQISVEKILQRSIQIISAGFQYPKSSFVRIVLDGQVYEEEDYKDTKWKLSRDLVIAGRTAGTLDVCCHEDELKTDKRPFITEEENLITAIAERLQNAISRKWAIKSLAESEERMQLALNGADLGTLDWNIETDKVTYNERWAEMLGYTIDELQPVLNTWRNLVPPDDLPKVREILNSHLEGKTDFFEAEHRMLHKSGKMIWILDKGKVIQRAPDGKALRMCGTHLDITARKHAEEDREKLEAQLYQAQKMEAVGQLAGGIAHDFNNLLTIIQGNAELLKLDGTSHLHATFSDEIIKSSARAAELTGQLLSFARKGKRQMINIDINKTITETINLLTHTIDKRIEISLDLQANPREVVGDPTQLHNALLNLGINARDAMPHGGKLIFATKNIAISREDCNQTTDKLPPGSYLEISVRDTGVGMDRKTRERAFEPFFTTKDVGKGTGLGLASVFGSVKSHDGNITIYSELGKGTEFRILLPAAKTEATASEDTDKEELKRGTGHVLIIDDEKSVRQFAIAAMHNLGYTVTACCDGLEAVDYFRRHHREIDLIILDLIMPNMNGEDTFHELKKIQPNVKVLISSGFSHTESSQSLLDSGALGLLNKPFRISQLAGALAKHL